MSEFDPGLLLVGNAFNRWMVRAMSALLRLMSGQYGQASRAATTY